MIFKQLKNKLWFNIFLKVGIIFVAFIAVLTVSNVSMLVRFFCIKEKNALVEQLTVISEIDIDDTAAVSDALSTISEKYNFEIEIYTRQGRIIYTTHGSQMMDYFTLGNDKFTMQHEKLKSLSSEALGNGIVFETAVRRFDSNEFLLCYKEIEDNIYAEIRIQKELISASAQIANEFILIVASICFVLSIIWVFLFARKFSQPITKMNDITRDMAELKFDRRLDINRSDEIGQLAASINDMSESLSASLDSLKSSNAKLRDEIELERQLDVMRRGFVANVSHELKTPIAIISGYAEGLKLNINAKSKEDYCNTIIDESARMNRLVLSILELSRYESGQIPINRQCFDISVIITDMLTRIFSDSGINTVNLVPADTAVSGDPVQLEQVVKSYLENARSHTPKGGTVTVTCSDADGGVRISVFNTESHIDEAIMPQIWQSFFRGDTSHKREKSRFGLGLSIVSAIMKLHGKPCGVSNTENGVCFWFEADKGIQTSEPTESEVDD